MRYGPSSPPERLDEISSPSLDTAKQPAQEANRRAKKACWQNSVPSRHAGSRCVFRPSVAGITVLSSSSRAHPQNAWCAHACRYSSSLSSGRSVSLGRRRRFADSHISSQNVDAGLQQAFGRRHQGYGSPVAFAFEGVQSGPMGRQVVRLEELNL